MKGGEGGYVVCGAFFVSRCEKCAEGAVRTPCPLHHSKKIFNVPARDPPVSERAQGGKILLVP